MGLTMKEKQVVTREYSPQYQKATKKNGLRFTNLQDSPVTIGNPLFAS
jgi:hypothetical protein